MSVPAAAGSRATQIEREGIRVQIDNLRQSSASSAAMGLVVALASLQHTGAGFAISWLACILLVCGLRLGIYRAYVRAGQFADLSHFGRLCTFASCISGLTWGIGSVLAYLVAPEYMLGLMVPMLIMLGAVSIFAATSHLPAFYVFFYSAALPPILIFFYDGRYLLGFAFLIYAGFMTHLVRISHRRYRENVSVKLDNLDLVEALRLKTEQAELANLAKSRFLAAASHDLRQPMHALSLFIESLGQSNLPHYESQLVDRMRQSATAMESLFTSLLDVSRLDAGTVEPMAQAFSLERLLTRLYSEFLPVAAERGLALRKRPSRQAATAYTDELLLSRIVSNLLSNAIRHGLRVGNAGVLLALRSRGSYWAIEIWDTGPGIAEAEQQLIFGEFYQVDTDSAERHQGLGLGLSIVDRLVKLLALDLQMRSRLGQGTLFRVLVRKSSIEVPESAAQALPDRAVLAGLFVLLIDDEEVISEAMEALLSQWGCSTLAATSSAALKSKLRHEPRVPDLLICDYRLGEEQSGMDAIEELRDEYNRKIPALVITGDTLPERLKQAAARGIPIVHKPLNPLKLRELMEDLITQHRANSG